jgi:hypothetical protein
VGRTVALAAVWLVLDAHARPPRATAGPGDPARPPAQGAARPAADEATRPASGDTARAAAGQPAPFLAGAAVRTITPDLGPAAAPVILAGGAEGRVATGVRDDITTRALVLEAGGGAVAVVVLDLFGLARDDAERIRAAVRGRTPAVPLAGIMVSCTRTHSAPDATGQFAPQGIDAAWLERLVQESADAVEEAWRARQPARLSFAAARLPRLLTDARQPMRYDDQAAFVRVERTEGKIGIASLVFFSGSPETLGRRGRLVSADYAGEARRAIEDAFGGPAILLVGASGGLMVPVAPAGASEEPPVAVGRALARALQVAWSGREEVREGLPADLTNGAIAFRTATALLAVDGSVLREAFRTGRRRGHVDASGRLVSEVGLLTLSSAGGPILEVACLPGAIYPELINGGIQEPQDPAADRPGDPAEAPVRSILRAPLRLVAGACGDDLGDIIPASEWDEKPPFAYGLKTAQRGEESSPGPGTARTLLKSLADLMR